MDIRVLSQEAALVEADALVVGLCKEEGLTGIAARLNQALGGALQRLVDDGEMKGEPGQLALYHVPDGQVKARRVVLVGLGPRAKVDAERLRLAAGSAARFARDKNARRMAFALEADGLEAGTAAQATVEGALLGLYRFQNHKSKKEEKAVEAIDLVSPGGAGGAGGDVNAAVERGRILAEATCLSRDLANEPGNAMPPRLLAEAAREALAGTGVQVEVFDEARIAQEEMGALLGVSRGSVEPPRFIVMRYKSGRPDSPVLALVGKGLTFDAGGISIKPAEGMEDMKMDKSGGCAVIGAMQAIARLKPNLDVVGIVPASENLPGGSAQKPGDVVRALNGKTIEVINTDAEGRLILADAVAYAAKIGARWLVDIATLTGAVVIALGHQAAAVLGNDDALVEAVRQAGSDVGERYWPMPTYDEFKDQYKSQVADIKNVGGRAGGTITGGLIIGEFVGETKWAHLDIAGVAWHDKDLPYQPKGATAFGLRTMVRLAERLAGAEGGA